MMPTIVPVRMSKHCTARLKTPEPRYSTMRYRPAMTVPTSMGKLTVSSSPFRFGSKTTLRLKWCSERSLHSTSSSSSESSCSPCSRAGSGGAARRDGANGSAGAVLAPVRPGTHEGGRRARLKEDDAVLVANRRDIPSDPLECERRVRLRGRVASVGSVCGGSRLAARKPQLERRRGRGRESLGLNVGATCARGATCGRSGGASLGAASLVAESLCPLGADSSPMPPLSALLSLSLEL